MINQLQKYLVDLSDQLDAQGYHKYASTIDQVIESESLIKVAQYVGVIGYVLRQNRALGNCVRKKRASSGESMQQIVMGCLKEYQDGNQYRDTEWAKKYAQVIKHDPSMFDKSHIAFAKAIYQENNIDEHINRVKESVDIVKNASVADNKIQQIVSNFNYLMNILEKEGWQQQSPFKVAATGSQRKWWQRLFSPSWTRRGQDKDTQLEMSNVLLGLRKIQYITQKMIQDVRRLKESASLRLNALMSRNKTMPENIELVIQKIKEIDITNWSKTIVVIQQLNDTISSIVSRNPDIREEMNTVSAITNELTRQAENVYGAVRYIQKNMFYLRQREPVRGRKFNDNVSNLASPAQELDRLEQILSRLYQNPFDERSIYFAHQAHRRLDDRLRWIDNSTDNEELSEMKNYVQSPLSENEDFYFNQQAQQPSVSSTETYDSLIDKISDSIVSSGTDVNEIISSLEQILYATQSSADGETKPSQVQSVIQKILDSMIQRRNLPGAASDYANPEPEIETTSQDMNPQSEPFSPHEKMYRDRHGVDFEGTESAAYDSLEKSSKILQNVVTLNKIANILDQYKMINAASWIDQHIQTSTTYLGIL